MPYNWYVATPYELMVDLDPRQKTDGGEWPAALKCALARLNGLRIERRIDYVDHWIYPSDSNGHYHLIVRHNGGIGLLERMALQLYLRDDSFRAMNNLMRMAHGDDCPSLLITSEPYDGFYRLPDETCNCTSKHTKEVMRHCTAASRIRGNRRCDDYFGKPSAMNGPISFGRGRLDE